MKSSSDGAETAEPDLGAELDERLAVVDGQKAKARPGETPAAKTAHSHGQHSKKHLENIHDAVVGKYRGQGVFYTACNLAFVATAVLLIARSSVSNAWIVLVVAVAALLVYLQSKNISNSYIEEAQRLMRQEVGIVMSA